MINFDAPAILERQNIADLGNGKYGYTSVDQIFIGHLSEAIYRFDHIPEREKPHHRIVTSDVARIGKTYLESTDIEKLLEQPNYPLRGF